MKNDNILVLENVTKSFSGVQVLKGINLELNIGEILAVVGENGAGKSTLMNIMAGVLPRDSGLMKFGGEEYQPSSPRDADRLGFAFIHQELNLFLNLSIAENMFIQDFPSSRLLRKIDFKRMKAEAGRCLDMLGCDLSPEAIVGDLTMGQRQLVEIAKALNKKAKVMIFDEPTTSLSNNEKANLFKVMKALREQGTCMIYISHILEDVFELSDRIVALRDGVVTGSSPTRELTKDQVIKWMVGRDLHQLYPDVEKNIGATVFRIKNFSRGSQYQDINLDIKEGEIVGLFGIVGAGRTEFARGVFGLDKRDSGEVYYREQAISPLQPIQCIKHGLAFITENRRFEGLFMTKTVQENLVSTKLNELADKAFKVINAKKEAHYAEESIKNVSIKTYNKDRQEVNSLSGGNQQKVVIGKWLLNKPKILILDEPTRGIDVGAKYEIYSIINSLAKDGSAVLMISSEMEELMGTCDRILVMTRGRIVRELRKGEYDQETIISAAIGGEQIYAQA